MLFGEYAVLAGAWACALPVKFRQNLEVLVTPGDGKVQWQSFDFDGKEWMNCQFRMQDDPSEMLSVLRPLRQMLDFIAAQKPDLCGELCDLQVRIKASFRKEWGLGSSSALIANLARWSGIDPFALMDVSFPGSGYDVAAAFHDQPVLYRLDGAERVIEPLPVLPGFLEDYRVVFLGKKVNSRDSVSDVREAIDQLAVFSNQLNQWALEALEASVAEDFNRAMSQYEQLLSQVLGLTPTGNQFPEYQGFMKSLGAWGGDALLAEYHPGDFEAVFGHLTSFKLAEIARWP